MQNDHETEWLKLKIQTNVRDSELDPLSHLSLNNNNNKSPIPNPNPNPNPEEPKQHHNHKDNTKEQIFSRDPLTSSKYNSEEVSYSTKEFQILS